MPRLDLQQARWLLALLFVPTPARAQAPAQPPSMQVSSAARALHEQLLTHQPGLTLAQRETVIGRKHEIDRTWPVPRASFDDAIAHLLHAIRTAGIDHVGIGADLDGGGGVTGFEDARDYPKITARLLREGYSRADIEKVWSGNVLRVLRAAEAYSRSVAAQSAPITPVAPASAH